MDKLSKTKRSWNMSRIPSKNTKPELFVRKLLFKNGYRYRLNDKKLPGKPDIVFKNKKKVIFVHGCFWHRHQNCKYSTNPKTNISFWKKKFLQNKKRDELIYSKLDEIGWSYFVVWECKIKDKKNNLIEELNNYLCN